MEVKRQRPLGPRGRTAIAFGLCVVAGLAVFAVVGGELRLELPGSHREAAMMALDTVLGATVEQLDSATARSLGIGPGSVGLVVTSVAGNGPAGQAGIRVGDVIERIEGKPTGSVDQAAASVKASRGTIILTLNRRGNHAMVRLPVRPVHNEVAMVDQGDGR